MVHNVFTYRSLFACLLILFTGCTEPFEIETPDFEDILIINASITTEPGQQEVYITRSYASGEDEVRVSGATVEILVNGGERISFEQAEPGLYRTADDFIPVSGVDYRLRVVDENGETFTSSPVRLTEPTTINSINARQIVNEAGETGVEITVDGSSNNPDAPYFRYEYEETYRIRSFFNPQDELVIVSEDPPLLEIRTKEREENICYVTEASNRIFISETDNLQENVVSDYPLRFIERRDRRVAERYSILVKQYALSNASYQFYQTLLRFSSSDNLFSQPQPGLIVGNVQHENNPDIKVVGLFEVVSLTQDRIFFDFRDVFDPGPRYLEVCETDTLLLNDPELFELVKSEEVSLVEELPGSIGAPISITVADRICVDCNLTGTNVVPEFWEE